jgi:hypothetical protein
MCALVGIDYSGKEVKERFYKRRVRIKALIINNVEEWSTDI